ncbi:MAG TPA: serine hydrolase domain-containing protein [Caulobacteraceae bacterium]|jgi:CubicO group peptidase (beta-lactamase class C family)
MKPITSLLTAALAACALTLPAWAQSPAPTLVPPKPRAEVITPAALPGAASANAQLTAQDVEAWLDGFFPYALQRGDVAGAVVVVVKDGQVLFEKGYGYADVKARKPVDPKLTLFRPGSVSKLFTWTAVMQLVEQGKLNLDADVNTYLDFKIPPRDGKPVTLRNIMTHTAGFEEQVKGLISAQDTGPLDDHLKAWVPKRVFAPGTTPAYSNYATALAGYIVQRVSGQPFNDYIDQHVLAPIGMTHSSFRQPLPKSLQPLMSKGYQLGSGEAKPYEYISLYPAGSLAASGDDMGKFMIAHLNNGGPLLKPATAQMMHGTPLTVIPGVNRMLLGFYEQNRNGHRILGHGGDTQWFHSNLHLYPEQNVGLFVSVNSPGKEGAAGPIRSALFEGFTDRYFLAAPGPQPRGVDLATAKKHAALMAGLYGSSRGSFSTFLSMLSLASQAKVLDNGDGTISVADLKGLNGQPKKWREIAPFLWQEVGGDAKLAAEVKAGKVVRFTGDEIAPFMMFSPIPAATSSSWLLPALIAALAALALTGLLWPVTALARRKYRAPFVLEGQGARAYRWVRIAALAAVATLVAWGGAVTAMFSDLTLLTSKMDPVLWLLHILALVVFVGGAAIGIWNAYVVWRSGRGWLAKLWSVVVALSFLILLYVALTYKLIGFGVNY